MAGKSDHRGRPFGSVWHGFLTAISLLGISWALFVHEPRWDASDAYLHANAYPIIPFAFILLGVLADIGVCGWGHRHGKRLARHQRTAAVVVVTFPLLMGLVVFTGSIGLGSDGQDVVAQTGVAIILAIGLLVLVGYAGVAVRWMVGDEWRMAIALLILLMCLFTFIGEFSLFGLDLLGWTTWLLLIGAFIWVSIDASRRGHSRLWWPLFSFVLPFLALPIYLGLRNLNAEEVRRGGRIWNIMRNAALLWTLWCVILALSARHSPLLQFLGDEFAYSVLVVATVWALTTLPWMGAARCFRNSNSVETGPTEPKVNMEH